MNDQPIGIVGLGFVGEAMYYAFNHDCGGDVYCYDKFKKLTPNDCNSLDELLQRLPEGPIFVCVPTPMSPDGRCDLRIVKEVLGELDELAFFHNPETSIYYRPTTVVIKSTVPPGTTKELSREFPRLDLVFNPEFLTERNHVEDFRNQTHVILGGDVLDLVADAYVATFPNVTLVLTDSTTAEMIKYVANTFLAAKVSLANEYYDLCQAMGVDYNNLVGIIHMDPRLGKTHWRVPGPDGERGFSGACFPKDVNALIRLMEDKGCDPAVLKAAWQTNMKVRPSRDWEKLKGRAVSESPPFKGILAEIDPEVARPRKEMN
jgi:nucleotide sugar dehydrogenase